MRDEPAGPPLAGLPTLSALDAAGVIGEEIRRRPIAAALRGMQPFPLIPGTERFAPGWLVNWHQEYHAWPERDVACYTVPGAVISGTGQVWLDGRLITSPEIMPPYVAQLLDVAGGGSESLRAVMTLPIRTIETPCLVAVGHDSPAYGHFLIEVLFRILVAQRAFAEERPAYDILLDHKVPAWLLAILTDTLGIGRERIVFFDPETERVCLRQAILPSLPHQDGWFHPIAQDMLSDVLGGLGPALPTSAHRRIAVIGQSGPDSGAARRLIELAVTRHGFVPIDMENLGWREQISFFRGADIILGQAGGRLFNALFARPDSLLASIGINNLVQSEIGALTRQRNAYFMPIDPGPRAEEDCLAFLDAVCTWDPSDTRSGAFVAPSIAKQDGVRLLAARLCEMDFDPDWGPVPELLSRAAEAFGTPRNGEIGFVATSPDQAETLVHPQMPTRSLRAPVYLNGRPASFPSFSGGWSAATPALRAIRVAGGFHALCGQIPLLLDSSRQVIESYSSRYGQLMYFYDRSMAVCLDAAPYVDGTVLAIVDDVVELNYCHWTADWLSRLAPFAASLGRPDFFVVTSPMSTPWQRRSLALCGVAEDRIIEIAPWRAVQAREVIVLSSARDAQHPAYKGADWALDFLRSHMLAAVGMDAAGQPPGRRKLYISRDDASGRRVVNEAALLGVLETLGYERITLTGLTLDRQIELFAGASHVVGVHGAGLTNILFCPPDCTVIEILPQSYGTPAFCVLALALGLNYHSYVAAEVVAGDRPQLDDVVIDLEDFLSCSATMLSSVTPPHVSPRDKPDTALHAIDEGPVGPCFRRAPICIFSFNRPDCLRDTLVSIMDSMASSGMVGPVILFQDGNVSSFTGIAKCASVLIAACKAVFQELAPHGVIFQAPFNLGTASNIYRAEKWAFDEMSFDVAVFFEDDMIVAPRYFEAMEQLNQMAEKEPRIGMFSAYGSEGTQSPEEQHKKRHTVGVMHHNRAFGLRRTAWLAREIHTRAYMDIIEETDYRHRSPYRIAAWYMRMGWPPIATDQDIAKCVALNHCGMIRISTQVVLAKYIGSLSEHCANGEYDRLQFDEAVLYADHFPDEPITLDPLTDEEIEAIWRVERDKLLGSTLATKMLLLNPEFLVSMRISAAIGGDKAVKSTSSTYLDLVSGIHRDLWCGPRFSMSIKNQVDVDLVEISGNIAAFLPEDTVIVFALNGEDVLVITAAKRRFLAKIEIGHHLRKLKKVITTSCSVVNDPFSAGAGTDRRALSFHIVSIKLHTGETPILLTGSSLAAEVTYIA